MRIHPSSVESPNAKWHIPVAGGLVFLLLLTWLFPRTPEAPPPPPPVPKRAVLVVKTPLTKLQPIPQEAVQVEERPVSDLPADALTSFDEIKGRVPEVELSVGFFVSQSFLLDPATLVKEEPKEVKPVDDCEQKLTQLRNTGLINVPITFTSSTPKRCTRVAVQVSNQSGTSMLLVDEGYIEESSGTTGKILVRAEGATALSAAMNKRGALSYFEISGKNPYSGQPMPTAPEVIAFLEPPSVDTGTNTILSQPTANPIDDPETFCSGLARSGDEIFCTGKDGHTYLYDPESGQLKRKSIADFNDLKREEKSLFGTLKSGKKNAGKAPETEKRNEGSTEPPIGLEPLFPLVGG